MYADRSLAARHRGATADALAHATRALALAEDSGDPEALAQAHNIVGMLLRRPRASRAQPRARRGRCPIRAWRSRRSTTSPSRVRARATRSARSSSPARALALCSRQGDRHREAALHNNLADLLHRAGRSDEAMAHLKQAAATFAEIGGDADEMQPEVWMLVEW